MTPETDASVPVVRLPHEGPGRPSNECRKAGATLFAALRDGNFIDTACHLAGLEIETVNAWCLRGLEEQSGQYRRFAEAVQKAQAAAEAKSVGRIREAGKKNWKADITWLGRRHRDRWAERLPGSDQDTTVRVQIGIALPGTPAHGPHLLAQEPITVVPRLPSAEES